MTSLKTPTGLASGGRALWRSIAEQYDLEAVQIAQLEEACRAKDRLDKLDQVLRGDADTWMSLAVDVKSDGSVYELRITNALGKANDTANLMKQLLAALRLPDAQSGKRPQYRGPRGAQAPSTGGSKVSSLDKARAAKSS